MPYILQIRVNYLITMFKLSYGLGSPSAVSNDNNKKLGYLISTALHSSGNGGRFEIL